MELVEDNMPQARPSGLPPWFLRCLRAGTTPSCSPLVEVSVSALPHIPYTLTPSTACSEHLRAFSSDCRSTPGFHTEEAGKSQSLCP